MGGNSSHKYSHVRYPLQPYPYACLTPGCSNPIQAIHMQTTVPVSQPASFTALHCTAEKPPAPCSPLLFLSLSHTHGFAFAYKALTQDMLAMHTMCCLYNVRLTYFWTPKSACLPACCLPAHLEISRHQHYQHQPLQRLTSPACLPPSLPQPHQRYCPVAQQLQEPAMPMSCSQLAKPAMPMSNSLPAGKTSLSWGPAPGSLHDL